MDDAPRTIKNRSLELKWAREQVKILKKRQVLALREKYLDTSDVMMALRISRRTMQKFRDQGILPFIRLQGKLFYKIADITSLLQSRYIKRKKTKNND